MKPFLISFEDFENYTHTQTLASGPWSKGRKVLEYNTQIMNGQLHSSIRIVKTYIDEPSMTHVYPCTTIEIAIEKFNSIR